MSEVTAATLITMDVGTFIGIVATLFFFMVNVPIVWVLRITVRDQSRLEKDMRDLEKDHKALVEKVSSECVHKDDYRDDINRLEQLCKSIFDKLDGKADKAGG